MTASRSRSERNRLATVAAAVLAGALLGALLSLAAGESARRALFDTMQRVAPRDVTADKVAVVLIDMDSLRQVGSWPWPRSYLAELLDKIAAQQPKVIAFDMVFAEPDGFSPEHFVKLYPELDPATAGRMLELPNFDEDFAGVIQRNPVLLPRLGVPREGADPTEYLTEPVVTGNLPPNTPKPPQLLASIHALDDIALAHALINGPPDDDGLVRRVPLTLLAGGVPMPGLAVEIVRLMTGAAQIAWRDGRATVGNLTLPADDEASLALRFGRFPERAVHSAENVLRARFPENTFTGKAVLIGLGAEGTADIVATPIEAEGYGVIVQAQAVDAILRGGWLARPPWLIWAEWAAGALLVALTLLAAVKGARWPLAVGAALAIGMILSSWLAFDVAHVLFDPLRPLLVGMGAAGALALVQFVRTRAERARLAEALVEQRVAGALQEGELQAARRIQLGMVPSARKLAALDPRVEIAATLKPARQVGGDFYDAVRLDADRLLFVVGDVTGKGVPAALYMALSKTLTKSVLIRHKGALEETVASINDELLREADEDMGVTMLIVLLDASTGELAMVNAGHENPIVVRADGSAEVLPLTGGPPFCVCPFPYPAERALLGAGETLVLISDGVTEAQDGAGALFGIRRTVGVLAGPGDRSASGQVERLKSAVATFEGDKEASDDLTIVAIRFGGDMGA